MKIIILNSKNFILNSKNRFIYKFNNTQRIKGKMALASLIMPYSQENINKETYNNSTFQIIYNGQTTNISIPDGFYTLENLNYYLQYMMRETNNNIPYNIIDNNASYFLEFKYDTALYSVKLIAYPTTLSGTPGKPNSIYNGYCPQININSNFSDILGLQQNKLYPSIPNSNVINIIYSKDEGKVPNLSPSNAYIMLCNIINNNISIPQNILYSFTPNTTYGSNINIYPPSLLWVDIYDNNYSYLEIEFIDENNNKLNIKDTNLIITLVIEE